MSRGAAGGWVAAGEARLRWQATGSGPEALLIHAGAADARMWDGMLAALDGRLRCVTFDMRGYGESPSVAGPYSPVEDCVAVMDAAGLQAPLVAGASFGGLVALELASARPDRVARVVLLDPLLLDQEWSEEMLSFEREEEEALARGDVDAAAALNVAFWAGEAGEPQKALLHEMQARAFRLQAVAEPDPVWPDPPVHARLGRLDLPVTVVSGERDVADFRAIARRLAGGLPRGRLAVLGGCGHLPALERPEEVSALLLAAAADG